MRIPSGAGTTPQPDDMRIIDALKVRYKKVYLTELLNLFDVDRGHEQDFEKRKKQPCGCKGFSFGGKATVLNSIEVINIIWSKDKK